MPTVSPKRPSISTAPKYILHAKNVKSHFTVKRRRKVYFKLVQIFFCFQLKFFFNVPFVSKGKGEEDIILPRKPIPLSQRTKFNWQNKVLMSKRRSIRQNKYEVCK